MTEIKYDDILELLVKYFPEFCDSEDYRYIVKNGSGDLPYVVFGVFFNYYIDQFKKNNKDFVEKANMFLEEMAKNADTNVVELLAIGFLENMNPSEAYFRTLVDKFSPRIRKLITENSRRNSMLAAAQRKMWDNGLNDGQGN